MTSGSPGNSFKASSIRTKMEQNIQSTRAITLPCTKGKVIRIQRVHGIWTDLNPQAPQDTTVSLMKSVTYEIYNILCGCYNRMCVIHVGQTSLKVKEHIQEIDLLNTVA